MRGSVPRHRIQAWSLQRGRAAPLVRPAQPARGHRGDGGGAASSSSMQRPGADRDAGGDGRADRPRCCPSRRLAGRRDWQPLHPRAWRREFCVPALIVLAGRRSRCLLRTPWALLGAAAGAAAVLARARLGAAFGLLRSPTAWSRSAAAGSIASWRFAETRKLQALEWRQSPFDRRCGMATLRFDTAGANAMEPALAIPYLPEAEPRAPVRRSSSRGLARTRRTPVIRSRTAGVSSTSTREHLEAAEDHREAADPDRRSR